MDCSYKDIEYCGKKLSDFNKYCIGYFEGSADATLGMKREIIKGDPTKHRHTPNHLGTKWTEPITFELDIFKDPEIYHGSDLLLTREEIRELNRWLTSISHPSWLNILSYRKKNIGFAGMSAMSSDDIVDILDENYQTEYQRYKHDAEMTNEEVTRLFDNIILDENEKFKYEEIRYCGLFDSVEAFMVGGAIVGLRAYFTNDSPFAYTPDIVNQIHLNGIKEFTIHNESDLLDSYNYPTLTIDSGITTDFYLCNTSDCNILDCGKMVLYQDEKYIFPSDVTFPSNDLYPYMNENNKYDNFVALYNAISQWAKNNKHDIDFYYDYDALVHPSETTFPSNVLFPYQSLYNGIQTFAEGSCLQFKLTDSFGYVKKCFGIYLEDGRWFIYDGGFLRIRIKKDIPITIDFENMIMSYEDGTLVEYKDLAVEDIDYIYWLKLVSGANHIYAYGENCNIQLTRIEERKVGAT